MSYGGSRLSVHVCALVVVSTIVFLGWSSCLATNQTTIVGLADHRTALPVYFCPSEASDRSGGVQGIWFFEGQCPTDSAVASYVGSAGANTAGVCSQQVCNGTNCPCEFVGHHFQSYGSQSRHSGIFSQMSAPSDNVNFRKIKDGQSTTLLLGEVAQRRNGVGSWWSCQFGGWPLASTATGINWPGRTHSYDNSEAFASYHEGGAQFAMADGSARFISENIDLRTFAALGTRAGDEVIGEY